MRPYLQALKHDELNWPSKASQLLESSAFGRVLRAVDQIAMARALYPILAALRAFAKRDALGIDDAARAVMELKHTP